MEQPGLVPVQKPPADGTQFLFRISCHCGIDLPQLYRRQAGIAEKFRPHKPVRASGWDARTGSLEIQPRKGSAFSRVTFIVPPFGSSYSRVSPTLASNRALPSGELGEYASRSP